ncbi:hypothetical protein [uncultured Mobiluncus sp.]|uniref:hypothetical protein n=1 Tax=uncultured Mobiluncus sp. TaxID=293425 RepID=UPI0026078BF4|nr:hypothetical protein [uncultured Mobiluncus sp.]
MDNFRELSCEDARNLIGYTCRPMGKYSSVRYCENAPRIVKAQEQAKKQPVPPEEIIKYVNEFLKALDMPTVESPRLDLPSGLINDELEDYIDSHLYAPICDAGGDCRDLVWMKFTNLGFLGVVAVSNDINFDIPKDGDSHLCKRKTSGIIVHALGQSWDRRFVLAFPLKSIPEDLRRGHIETGIGNYLIERNVPILDYYSHRY